MADSRDQVAPREDTTTAPIAVEQPVEASPDVPSVRSSANVATSRSISTLQKATSAANIASKTAFTPVLEPRAPSNPKLTESRRPSVKALEMVLP